MDAVTLVTKDFARTTLGAGQRTVVRALAEAMFSPDGEVSAERLDALVTEVDRYISPASKTLRFGLLVMLAAIRWSPIVFLRFRTFEQLSVDDRIRHLERLETTRLTQLALVLVAYKTMLTMLFYEDEGEQQAIGYPGAKRERWRRGLAIVSPPDGREP